MRHCAFTMINKLTDNTIPAEVQSEEQTDVFEARNCLADKELDAGECSELQGNLKWMAEDWAAENTKWHYISFDYKSMSEQIHATA